MSGIQLAGVIVALISGGFAITAGVYAFVKQHYRDLADRIRMTQFGVALLAAIAVAGVVLYLHWHDRSDSWVSANMLWVGIACVVCLIGWLGKVTGHKLEADD
ncbi:hypothetical protein [Nocardia sp. NPDC051981]|uniref:hypothetical protein n=1 Tax=Nocardia sp. NPDC051981 TaxID=3155417 RepID=UPI003427E379